MTKKKPVKITIKLNHTAYTWLERIARHHKTTPDKLASAIVRDGTRSMYLKYITERYPPNDR